MGDEKRYNFATPVDMVLHLVCLRLERIIGPPKDNLTEAAAVYQEFAKALRRYSPAVLEQAMDEFIAQHKRRTWPVPGAITELAEPYAAREHARYRAEREARERAEQSAPSEPTARLRAAELIRGELGGPAVQESWISPLFEFCCRRRRLPNEDEIPDLVEQGRRIAAEIQRLERELDADPSPLLRTCVTTMRHARNRLARVVQGEPLGA